MEAQACRAAGRPELDHWCLGLPGCPCALQGAQHMVGVRGSWVREREWGERGLGEGREDGGIEQCREGGGGWWHSMGRSVSLPLWTGPLPLPPLYSGACHPWTLPVLLL